REAQHPRADVDLELRPRGVRARGLGADRVELVVEVVARAGGVVAVAVARDAREADLRPLLPAAGAAAGGPEDDGAVGRLAVERQLPADHARERVDHGGRRRGAVAVDVVAADRRNAGRLGVEALRLGADDGLVDPTGAALVDRAVAVD